MVCGLVWLQEHTPKICVLKKTGSHAQSVITISSSIVNIIFIFVFLFLRGGEGRLHTHLMSMKIFSFGNEPDLYEESDHILDFDLLSILHLSCVSYPRRSGLVKISNRLGVVYLTT